MLQQTSGARANRAQKADVLGWYDSSPRRVGNWKLVGFRPSVLVAAWLIPDKFGWCGVTVSPQE